MNLCCASEEFHPRCVANQFSNSNAQRVKEAFPWLRWVESDQKPAARRNDCLFCTLSQTCTQSSAHHSRCLQKGFGDGVTCQTEESFTGFLTPAWGPVRLDMCLMFGFSLFLCLSGTAAAETSAVMSRVCWGSMLLSLSATQSVLDRCTCCSAGHAFNLKGMVCPNVGSSPFTFSEVPITFSCSAQPLLRSYSSSVGLHCFFICPFLFLFNYSHLLGYLCISHKTSEQFWIK